MGKQIFKVLEERLSDDSCVYDVVLYQGDDMIRIYCLDQQHADRVAGELMLAGFTQA